MHGGRFLALTAAFTLSGCLRILGTASLQASSPGPPAGMGCSACHPYSLQDKNHYTHIIYNSGVYLKRVNGFLTCLDCHRESLRYTTEILIDSIYRDSAGELWSSVDFAGSGKRLPGTLLRVDTLRQHHPVPRNGKALQEGELREWVTGLAHLNGRVDVVFDSAVSDPARFRGAHAEFNPKLETCSAVRCHLQDGPYRFEACAKGLPEWVGDPGPNYPCDAGP